MTDIDKNQVRAAFDRAAESYDAKALFQHEVCAHLADFITGNSEPSRILDAGCGTGYGAQRLKQRWPQAAITGCDLAPEMVRKTNERGIAAVCGDLEHLPFTEASFDLVWSNLALQWCDPHLAYAEFRRVLAPGGRLVFTTLANGTLHELDAAFSGIDPYRRVLPFRTADEVTAALAEAGFCNIRVTPETWVTRHADFAALLSTIRGIGASHTGSERRKSLMGKATWLTAKARYEALRGADDMLPATYEILFVHAEIA